MPTENTQYVNFLKNEVFLNQFKEEFEARLKEQLKHFHYKFITHVKPDKEGIDIDQEFYVIFSIDGGYINYKVVYDETPKKLKVGWTYSGEPVRWKKALKSESLKSLKSKVKSSQFQRLNVDAVAQVRLLFFGILFSVALNRGFVEDHRNISISDEEDDDDELEEDVRETKPPEQLKQEIDEIISKIGKDGWSPELGKNLGWCYFDLGELDKAEAVFFKYLDATKAQDIPSFIYLKWAASIGEGFELVGGSSKGPTTSFGSFSKEELLEIYKEARENYLKDFNN